MFRLRKERLTSFPRILKPLERFREHLLVINGLAHHEGNALGDGPGDHARAAATILTGVHPKKTQGADILLAPSADQIAAEEIGKQHATAFARAGTRKLGHGGQLRFRL